MTEDNIYLRNIYAMKILKKVNKLTRQIKNLGKMDIKILTNQHGGSESLVGLVNGAMGLMQKDKLGQSLGNSELQTQIEMLKNNSKQLKTSLETLHNGIEGVKPNLQAIINHLGKNIGAQQKLEEMIQGIKRLGELGFDKIVDEINKNAKEFEPSESGSTSNISLNS
jgi:hypothetical protein